MDLSVLKLEENCDLLRSKISTAIIICYKMKKNYSTIVKVTNTFIAGKD